MITLDADIHALIKQFWIVAGVKVGRTLVCGAGHLRIRRTSGQSYDEQNSDASHEASCKSCPVSVQLMRPVSFTGYVKVPVALRLYKVAMSFSDDAETLPNFVFRPPWLP